MAVMVVIVVTVVMVVPGPLEQRLLWLRWL